MSKQIILQKFSLIVTCLTLGLIANGCERKERVLDVNTPGGGGLEIDRNIDTGAVTVDVDHAK